MPPRARLLLIVSPREAKLLAYLTRAFAGVEGVEVVLDRRRHERRLRGGRTPDRRRADRRSMSGEPVVSHLFGCRRVRLPSRPSGGARRDRVASRTLLWPGLRLDGGHADHGGSDGLPAAPHPLV